MQLELRQDGAQLIDFTGGAYNIMSFNPGTPEHRDERVASVFHHGEEVLYVRHKNVIATLRLMVLRSTASLVDQAVWDISKILADIIALRGTAGEPIYLRFQSQGGYGVYDSELLSARVIQSDDRATENYERASKSGTTDSFFRNITIVFERFPWWQDIADTEISLSNGHGSGVGGIEVRNSNDAGNDNYAQIAGTSIAGTERTPLKIQVVRDVADSNRLRKVHISRNGRFGPLTTLSVFEIEDATAHYGSYSNVADTKYSAGNATRWNPMSTTYDFTMLYSSWGGTFLKQLRGRWFHILLTTDGLSANDVARVRFVLILGFDEITTTEWYDIDKDGVHDIGAIKIPPSYLGDIDHMSLVWELHGYDPNNSSTDIIIDSVHIMPSEPEDGYMIGEAWGPYLYNASGYMFDGLRKITYGQLGPSMFNMDYITKMGKYIEAVPGEDCRLLFVWDTYTSGGGPIFASADETYTVRAWFRSRYLHI